MYDPIIKTKSGEYHTVSGACTPDRERSIRLAKRHSSIQLGGEIVRVDTFQIPLDQYERQGIY